MNNTSVNADGNLQFEAEQYNRYFLNNIELYNLPGEPVATSTGQSAANAACPTNTYNLNLQKPANTAAYTYEWHIGADSSSAVVADPTSAAPGTYYMFTKSLCNGALSATGTAFTVNASDCTPPVVTVNPTNGSTIGGAAEPNSTVQVDVNNDGIADYQTIADGDGSWSITPPTPLPNGTVISVTATDAAGNTSAPVTTIVDATLPVKIISFEVQSENCSNILTWKSGEEKSFKHFEVQRKLNNEFVSIATIIAKGSNATYTYVDANAENGANIYRLQMTDLDGTISYSELKTLNKNCADASITVFPTVTKTNIKIAGTKANDIVMIYSAADQFIRKTIVSGNGETIDLSQVADGLYFVSVYRNNAKIYTQKVLKN